MQQNVNFLKNKAHETFANPPEIASRPAALEVGGGSTVVLTSPRVTGPSTYASLVRICERSNKGHKVVQKVDCEMWGE